MLLQEIFFCNNSFPLNNYILLFLIVREKLWLLNRLKKKKQLGGFMSELIKGKIVGRFKLSAKSSKFGYFIDKRLFICFGKLKWVSAQSYLESYNPAPEEF